jgi:hypothetical protein
VEGSIYAYRTSVYLECLSKTTEWPQSNKLSSPEFELGTSGIEVDSAGLIFLV